MMTPQQAAEYKAAQEARFAAEREVRAAKKAKADARKAAKKAKIAIEAEAFWAARANITEEEVEAGIAASDRAAEAYAAANPSRSLTFAEFSEAERQRRRRLFFNR